jgi:arsenate reductase
VLRGLSRQALAEFLGTAGLVCAVVGSGIAAQRLSPGDVGLQLLENSVATAFALIALILAFGSVSGAHLNPAVTLLAWLQRRMAWRPALVFVLAQVLGGLVGAILANLMFDLDAVTWSTTVRTGTGPWLGEVVATVGLLLTIHGTLATEPRAVPVAVGSYIGAAYWFTSSTSFANPAVTIARTVSDTFAGIAPASAPAFVLAQVVGVVVALGLVFLLFPPPEAEPEVAR